MASSPPRVRPTGSLSVKRRARATDVGTPRLTVLFADLRGYTGLAEQLPASRILTLLDEFFTVLASATTMHGGEVFHMAGDGMMAGFGGAPGYGARDALAAGHAMLKQFGELSARWRDELSHDTGIGVGLHLGDVAMGMLGPPGRKTRTLVGDTVNVAARLCSRARAGEVLLSCSVATALNIEETVGEIYIGPIPVLQLPQFALRGRSAPLDIWCVPAPERHAF
jgi:adenylate cyclase